MFANLSVVARRSEPADSLDFFPTPPWATRAMLSHLSGWMDRRDVIWEPACGEGHMAAVLAECGNRVIASDVFDYGYGEVQDFLSAAQPCDWVITNPPFKAAAAFARHAFTQARAGVALLVRLQWLESAERYSLFEKDPPARVLIYSGRVPMHKGRWEPDGTTATAYCWVVWLTEAALENTLIEWICPDAKRRFSRPEDAARFGAEKGAPLLGGPA